MNLNKRTRFNATIFPNALTAHGKLYLLFIIYL